MNKSFPLCYETIENLKHSWIILIIGIGDQLIDWPMELTQGKIYE